MEALTQEDMAARLAERIAKTGEYCAEQNVSAAIEQAKLAHLILDEVLAYLRPGVLESQVKEYAQQCFAKHGIERTWHPPYARFSEHTILTFQEKAKEDRALQEEDIAFVDLGIVRGGIEGDAGRTITFGNNDVLKHLADASQTIFKQAVQFWKANNPSGIELYEHIYALADKSGVKWNLDPAGHLIGAFPHKGWKRGINHFPEKIEAGKWILEIQIRHPELPIGSFYEDLLY